ncbi:MAG: hypothetical protein M1486_06875 [Gammaproteobacteria bacterium]|nr:hypothetical protein [Gammaproteobacteria bacterium]
MAEEQEEEIIIIEESDAAGVESAKTSDEAVPSSVPSSVNKKKIILIASALSALLLGGGIAFALLSHPADETTTHEADLLPSANLEEPKIQPSELERMIERANFMYANGNQAEALKLYEKK